MAFFSVVIPLFNKEQSIQNTIHSVLQQTYTDFEVIIINDGSTDGSEEKVLEIQDTKIRYFATKNQGVSLARNYGVQKAEGTLIAFLDADDYWYPTHLQQLIHLYNSYPHCGMYANNFEFFYNNTTVIEPTFIDIPKTPWRGIVTDFFKSSKIHRLVWTSAVAIPKNVFEKANGFDPKITMGAGEDIDLWIRLALNYKIAFDNTITTRYRLNAENRISKSNTLNRSFAKFNQFREEEKINASLKQFLDLYRAEFAIKHKIAGDLSTFKYYKKQIDFKNLSWKTRIILKLPVWILRSLFLLKKYLDRKNIPISIYH